jgi:hypothetical protein
MHMILLSLAAFVLVYAAPPVLGGWIGTLVRSPVAAFLLAWVMTPFIGLAIAVAIEFPMYEFAQAMGWLHDPYSSGRGMLLIIMPAAGVLTGLIAGLAASVVVRQRGKRILPEAKE